MISSRIIKGMTLASLAYSTIAFTAHANAFDLYTGEKSGAYNSTICPAIQKEAASKDIQLECKPSAGSLDNLDKVIANPSSFGLSQYDQFALKYSKQADKTTYNAVHNTIGSECLFLVTKNKLLTNLGDIAASAPYLNFILPPQKSGHAGTFHYLQSIDPDGLGKAGKVTYASSTEDAILQSLTSEDNVTLFVQTANPKSPLFTLVNKNKGHFVPVISREMLAQNINGTKVYKAEETAISNPSWYQSGEKVITSCTPIVLFTGNSDSITDPAQKAAHAKAIATLEAIPAKNLQPKKGWFSKFWSGSKALSAKGVEGLLEATDKAKKASSPYVNKAKNAAEPYVEKAKDATKTVIDAAKPTYDAAKEKTKEAIEAAKPVYEKAKEKTKEAIEAAKPTYEAVKEKTKEYGKKAMEKATDLVTDSKENPQPTE